MISADTNLFLYAANERSPHHQAAKAFFSEMSKEPNFVVCELVLIEIYIQLRNPTILAQPLSSSEAVGFCRALKRHPYWQHLDYNSEVSELLWNWADGTTSGFRKIIDARLAFTLLCGGVRQFATANTKDFQDFGFEKVWNPITEERLNLT
ncbi:MAG: TA system VapC family ribonuclease toxin [Vulcanimicrobiota bacterium]